MVKNHPGEYLSVSSDTKVDSLTELEVITQMDWVNLFLDLFKVEYHTDIRSLA